MRGIVAGWLESWLSAFAWPAVRLQVPARRRLLCLRHHLRLWAGRIMDGITWLRPAIGSLTARFSTTTLRHPPSILSWRKCTTTASGDFAYRFIMPGESTPEP